MLYEDDIVRLMCAHLESQGWEIISFCLGRKQGDDIVAERAGVTLLVECKGETSGDPTTKRYGLPFNGNQAYDHVAKAVLRCLKVTSRAQGLAAIAVPENPVHFKVVSEVAPALAKAQVGVYWVAADRSIREELPW